MKIDSIMEIKHFDLIDGIFTIPESYEILMTMINSKIQFHETHLMMCKERGVDDRLGSKNRIKKLKEVRNDLSDSLNDHFENGGKYIVKVNAKVNLEITEVDEN